MQANRRFGFIRRLLRARSLAPDPASRADTAHTANTAIRLTPSELEQAYRNLLLENLTLVESNQRLQERLRRQDADAEDSPATSQSIQALRNELAERSNRLRQLEYDNKRLERVHKRLAEHHQRLLVERASRQVEVERLRSELELRGQELADTKAMLRDKAAKVLQLTDRCFQLEARLQDRLAARQAANSDF